MNNYLVLNLLDYSLDFVNNIPEGGWTDEYKTTKLVLRYIPEGRFIMGSPEDQIGHCCDETQHEVFLTKPFYMGVFPVTQKQYELVAGNNPSEYKGVMRPVENVSYDVLRGRRNGSQWPQCNRVDCESFLGRIRAKTGLDFDLPTEAQWEYACRAGTATALNNGTELTGEDKCSNLDKLGRYCHNKDDGKGGFNEHTVVGSYLPNAWGLYDMHGNVWEWCLDWIEKYPNHMLVDPKGATKSRARMLRGGGWHYTAAACSASYRDYDLSDPDCANDCNGFRLALDCSSVVR